LAKLSRSTFEIRIAHAERINGIISTSALYAVKILAAVSGTDRKEASVSTNKTPTTILPLTCSNVFSSILSEGCPSMTAEPKICKITEWLTITASYGMYERIFREQPTI
jgi:hypothetical protein